MRTPRWLAVAAAVVFVFMLAPVALVIYMSFFATSYIAFPPDGYSLRWYGELLERRQLLDGLLYSFVVALLATALSLCLGVLAAAGLSRSKLPGKTWFENGYLLPLIIPSIVSGVALYVFLYNVSELINVRLVPTTWVLVIAHTLITLPWTFRLCYAGFITMGRDVEKASLDLGAGPVATLWRVTLPLLRPSLVGAATFAFIFSFADLEISLFLVESGRSTLPVAMVQYAIFKVDPTIAAVSTVQMGLIAGLLVISNRFVRFSDTFTGGTKQ